MSEPTPSAIHREQTHHPRVFELHRYVYAVLSRRSGGISIGVNLNPDKRCNFDCVYCQVDRTAMPQPETVPAQAVLAELEVMLRAAADGSLFRSPRFSDLPPEQKRVRDVALSGDGEPTSSPVFREVAEGAVRAIQKAGLNLPVVVITNCTGLDRAGVTAGLDAILSAGGQVWAKLDAGTEDFYKAISRSQVPFHTVLTHIAHAAVRFPITLQVCRFRLNGEPPPREDLDAWIERVASITQNGAVANVQLYTVARPPAESAVTPLTESELEAIAADIRTALPAVPISIFC